ncbi:MAG TPA: plastocyanin/azurin family copper-binding protein [Solirubrobacterales bacterium]|nr:plastocyanin/azurin family copper-binding protein [Solirubrobacterales bacterium]
MKRPAILVALALLALLAAPLATETARLGAGRAEATECLWQRHTKRVVKHVRRHGHVRRIVRHKHWWTCTPVETPTSGAPPAPTEPAPVPVDPPGPVEEATNRLAVKSNEYYFVLSRPKVHAGELTVELNNQGQDAHNLNLQLQGEEGEVHSIPETQSLQHDVAHFDLEPGTYRLWCSLPEHEEKGMHTTLVVE